MAICQCANNRNNRTYSHPYWHIGTLLILNRMTMITSIFWIVPVASVLALVFAWFFFRQMMK